MGDGCRTVFRRAGNAAYAVTADGGWFHPPLPYWARKWSNLVFVAASNGCIRALTAEGQLRTRNRTGAAPGGAGYVSLAVGASDCWRSTARGT